MDDYRSRISVGYAEEIKCTYSFIYLDKKMRYTISVFREPIREPIQQDPVCDDQ